MGKLIGNAVTLDGDTIRVTFEGEGVTDGTLAHIVSINTQMDGGGEYSPLKQTTASISCLVDGAELMRLCVSEQPVSVLIENEAQGSILFKGYAVPNSYNQALSGINDTITIECVDCLGYAKYIPYERGETFSVLTLATLFDNIAVALGLKEVRFPDDVWLGDADGNRTTRYDLLTVSDNIFYNSVNPEDIDGELLYEPVAMTYEEVLLMIAESLRLTWVQVGRVLFLIDEVKITDSRDIVLYRNSEGDIYDFSNGVVRSISEESFAASASCNASSLPHYSRVVINHAEGDGRHIQPSPFEREHLRPAEDEPFMRRVSTDERVAIIQLESLTYDEQNSSLVAYKRYSATEEMPRSYDNSWDVVLRLLHVGTEVASAARLRATFRGAVAPTAGRGIKVDIALRANREGDGWFWDGYELEYTVFLHLRISVTRNDVTSYYNSYTGQWQSEAYNNPIYFRERGDEYVFGAELSHAAAGNVIPLDEYGGVVDVELRTANIESWWSAVNIYRFDIVEAKVDSFAAAYPSPTSKYQARGQWKLNKVQEVTLPIDNYYYTTDKAFGNVIGGVNYKDIIIGGDSMIDRVWTQANLGDRLMWEMTLRDEANAITALDAFTCAQLWNGRKIVDGYMRDVLKNEITLTLI